MLKLMKLIWLSLLMRERRHDAPTAAHYETDGTFPRISSKYYWTGMRKFIADYVKSCSECITYKATNQKTAGLLQILFRGLVGSRRFN
ncbi:retrovirus-related Pol polyprotein from transposon 412 [Trichonephila clavipes]|nr:retrovirus-related Pol polyprotein from transposon 412 [Trichonephila clavipes]